MCPRTYMWNECLYWHGLDNLSTLHTFVKTYFAFIKGFSVDKVVQSPKGVNKGMNLLDTGQLLPDPVESGFQQELDKIPPNIFVNRMGSN